MTYKYFLPYIRFKHNEDRADWERGMRVLGTKYYVLFETRIRWLQIGKIDRKEWACILTKRFKRNRLRRKGVFNLRLVQI